MSVVSRSSARFQSNYILMSYSHMGGVVAVVNESNREINDTCERSAEGSLRWEQVGEEICKTFSAIVV